MTRPFSLFSDGDFDSILKSIINGGVSYVSSNFPPADVFIDKDKNFTFCFALAGYKKENIEISFSGDTMLVKVLPEDKKPVEGLKYLNRGIKNSKCASKYYVPQQWYDTDNSEAVFEDGLLTIKIPSKESEKPKLVVIK